MARCKQQRFLIICPFPECTARTHWPEFTTTLPPWPTSFFCIYAKESHPSVQARTFHVIPESSIALSPQRGLDVDIVFFSTAQSLPFLSSTLTYALLLYPYVCMHMCVCECTCVYMRVCVLPDSLSLSSYFSL